MWLEKSLCTAVRCRGPGTENVWSISIANVSTVTRFFITKSMTVIITLFFSATLIL